MPKFGIGQAVRRPEDVRLLTGHGQFADDVNRQDQLHGYFLRASYAHGEIRNVGTARAAMAPGVVAIYTGADLIAGGIGTIPAIFDLKSRDGSPLVKPPRHALAVGRVRHVGEPIALIVAETRAEAQDAAELIELEIEPLPAVTDVLDAVRPGAPQLWPDAPANTALDWEMGDGSAVDAAIAKAHHVTRLSLLSNRIVVNALEPRAALAEYDASSDRLTLHAPSQGVFAMQRALAGAIFHIPPHKLRVLTGDVGGGFGMKTQPYPEYVAILFAARKLGRPIKWRNDRSESFLSDNQGRDSRFEATLALDAEGNFTALRIASYANLGAYLSAVGHFIPTVQHARSTASVYRTPAIHIHVKCVFTNTTPVGPYRGAGRPEANYVVERLIDTAARETGRDRVALRRQNLIPPSAMPYRTPVGEVYDSGDFAAVLDKALAAADWHGFPARRAQSEANGRLRGIGVSCYLEATGGALEEVADIFFEPDGAVSIVTGTQAMGQGHGTAFPQVVAHRLGVPFERVRLVQGDSDRLNGGGGSVGSRSMFISGGALAEACDQVIERARVAAGHFLEAAVADIEFRDGRFAVAGTDRSIGLLDLAERVRTATGLPNGVPTTLDVRTNYNAAAHTYPNGCHIGEVEIDPETGVAKIVSYLMVDDVGTVINPMIVEGQVHGGVAQGAGQILMEDCIYRDGQLLTGSFMDYVMPRADDFPPFDVRHHSVPAKTNPLGAKGAGEAGTTGAMPTVMNAILDALSAKGIMAFEMPATPLRVWEALRQAVKP